MPRITQKEVLAERQDAAAPFLFDDAQMPVRSEVLQSIALRRYEHTGVRLLENDALALRLVELVLAGWGVKRIAVEMQISKHTVRAAKEELERQGKLAPLKERIVRTLGHAIEAGAEKYRDAIEDGFIAPAQIPVGLGILFDKRALALGEPTAIQATAGKTEELSVERLNAWVDGLPAVRVIEEQSIGLEASTEGKR